MESTHKKEIDFAKYEEIENHFIPKIKKWIDEYEGTELWVATEKIHGTNFCFISNGEDVQCAKRTSLLQPKDRFYNFQVIWEKYSEKVKELFHLLKAEIANLKLVRVYGEFYGGAYEHPEVEPITKMKPIQRGIWYCPFLEFECFDIAVQYEVEGQTDLCKQFYPYTKAVEFLKNVGIPNANILFQGTLKEVMEKVIEANPDKFQSTIYLKHGLPKIEDNEAEGFVVKQNEDGINNDGKKRYSIKVKNTKCLESIPLKPQQKKAPAEKTEEVKELIEKAKNYLTSMRFQNVVSKLMENERHPGRVKAMLAADAFKDFLKELDKQSEEVAKKNRNPIMNELKAASDPLVQKELAELA